MGNRDTKMPRVCLLQCKPRVRRTRGCVYTAIKNPQCQVSEPGQLTQACGTMVAGLWNCNVDCVTRPESPCRWLLHAKPRETVRLVTVACQTAPAQMEIRRGLLHFHRLCSSQVNQDDKLQSRHVSLFICGLTRQVTVLIKHEITVAD